MNLVTTSMCSTISIHELQKTIRSQLRKKFRVGDIQDKILEQLENFSVNNQKFKYSTFNNKMATIFVFLCPECNRKCRKLYLPKQGLGYKNLFLCHKCHKLVWESKDRRSRNFVGVIHPLRRLRKIEEKIANEKLSFNKACILLREYEALRKQLQENDTYKLYLLRSHENNSNNNRGSILPRL